MSATQSDRDPASGFKAAARAEASIQLASIQLLCGVSDSQPALRLPPNLEVCLAPLPSPCPTWTQFGLPCRHLVVALEATGSTDRAMSMFSPCYTAAAYADRLSSIRLPPELLLDRDESLLPACCGCRVLASLTSDLLRKEVLPIGLRVLAASQTHTSRGTVAFAAQCCGEGDTTPKWNYAAGWD